VNWQETKVHNLRSRDDEPLTAAVLGQQVAVVEEFVCLGSKYGQIWTEDKLKTDITKTKHNPEKANNTKHSKTKLT